MEGDSNDKGNKTKTSDSISDGGHVSEPDGFRCGTIDLDTFNRFLIRCEFGYVLPGSLLLWTLFLLFR